MIDGPIIQDRDYIEIDTGTRYTVLAANSDGTTDTHTVLDVLGVEVPCIVFYDQRKSEKVIVCAESAFRERFMTP
jgi:hypothetical protein